MKEYIPKDEVLEIIKTLPSDIVYDHIAELKGIWADEKTGRWIDTGEIWTDMYTADEEPIYKCSACNEEVIGGSIHFAYCPNCGARMEEHYETD